MSSLSIKSIYFMQFMDIDRRLCNSLLRSNEFLDIVRKIGMIHNRNDTFYTSDRLSKRMSAFIFPYEKRTRLWHDREVRRNSWIAINRLPSRSKTSFIEWTKDIFSSLTGLYSFGKLNDVCDEKSENIKTFTPTSCFIKCIYFCNLMIKIVLLKLYYFLEIQESFIQKIKLIIK